MAFMYFSAKLYCGHHHYALWMWFFSFFWNAAENQLLAPCSHKTNGLLFYDKEIDYTLMERDGWTIATLYVLTAGGGGETGVYTNPFSTCIIHIYCAVFKYTTRKGENCSITVFAAVYVHSGNEENWLCIYVRGVEKTRSHSFVRYISYINGVR